VVTDQSAASTISATFTASGAPGMGGAGGAGPMAGGTGANGTQLNATIP
jgi:hypothetical protein